MKTKNDIEIIAEIGQAHDGSLGIAHSYIDALKDTGIDVIKFQTHIAAAESSKYEPFRENFSREDRIRYNYWKRIEFTIKQWKGLKKHCEDEGIEFMSTPTCIAAVDLLEKVKVKRFKVGSGDTLNFLLLKRLALTNKPVLLSTGMSNLEEIKKAFKYCTGLGIPLSLLHCMSKYPSKPEDLRLNLIKKYKKIFNCPIGYSDHSGSVYPSIAAVTMGAEIIEFHVVFDKKMFGPDSSSSLTIDEVKELVNGIRYLEKANYTRAASKNDSVIDEMKAIFNKSIAVNKNLPKDHIISFEDLESKKPANMGVSVSRFEEIIGKKLKIPKNKYEFIKIEDIEN